MTSNMLSNRRRKQQSPPYCIKPPIVPIPIGPGLGMRLLATITWTWDPADAIYPASYAELFELTQQTNQLEYQGESQDLEHLFHLHAEFAADFSLVTTLLTYQPPAGPITQIALGPLPVDRVGPIDTGPLQGFGIEPGSREVRSSTIACTGAIGTYRYDDFYSGKPAYENQDTGWWLWWAGWKGWIVSAAKGVAVNYFWTGHPGQKPPYPIFLNGAGTCTPNAALFPAQPNYPQAIIQITQ